MQICTDASNDVARINAKWIDADGATTAEQIIGVRKVHARAVLAHKQLAELSVPPFFAQFVANEIGARAKGPQTRDIVAAIKSGDQQGLRCHRCRAQCEEREA